MRCTHLFIQFKERHGINTLNFYRYLELKIIFENSIIIKRSKYSDSEMDSTPDKNIDNLLTIRT